MSRLTQDKNLDLLAELYVAFGKNADELLGTDAGRDGAEPQRLGRLDGDDSCPSRPLDLVLRGTHSCQATRDGRYFFRITPGGMPSPGGGPVSPCVRFHPFRSMHAIKSCRAW